MGRIYFTPQSSPSDTHSRTTTYAHWQRPSAQRRGGSSTRCVSTPVSRTLPTTHSGITFGQRNSRRWGAIKSLSTLVRFATGIRQFGCRAGKPIRFWSAPKKARTFGWLSTLSGAPTGGSFDVALVLSQDQDLSEVAEEIRIIAQEQNRWLKITSAFPASPAFKNTKGIYRTDWIKIDRATYDTCIDARDYRPKKLKP